MVSEIRGTEGQMEKEGHRNKKEKESPSPAAQGQEDTEMFVHDDGIAEWVADSNITIKGHHSNKNALRGTQREVEIALGNASPERNSFVQRNQTHEHLWADCQDKESLQKRQVAEEEVHGALEALVHTYQGDDGKVSSEGKEKYK